MSEVCSVLYSICSDCNLCTSVCILWTLIVFLDLQTCLQWHTFPHLKHLACILDISSLDMWKWLHSCKRLSFKSCSLETVHEYCLASSTALLLVWVLLGLGFLYICCCLECSTRVYWCCVKSSDSSIFWDSTTAGSLSFSMYL